MSIIKRQTRFLPTLILVAVIFAASTPRVYGSPSKTKTKTAKSQVVSRVYVKPVRCQYKDCWECSTPDYSGNWKRSDKVGHGDLHVVYADGRDVKVKTSAPAVGDSNRVSYSGTNAPQVASDKRTVGWTQGEHHVIVGWSIGGTAYFNLRLAVYRNGRVLHLLPAPLGFIESWRFVNGSKQVAMHSRGHHGMGYVRLFDANSGKLLIEMSENEAAEKGVPWASN